MNAVDLFAGAGGWSHGWRMATGREPMLAVNHCDHAIALHKLNHPTCEHEPKDVWKVDAATVLRGRRVDWLHGSPDCTHFSRAKGGKPRKQRIRALAWVLAKWARICLPQILSIENVAEFLDWGPLHGHHSDGCTGKHRRPKRDRQGRKVEWIDGEDYGCLAACKLNKPIASRKGETFRRFVGQLQRLGYVVEWRVLCAADFGAPTIRKRLFLIARRDGQPIRWPEPTHGNPAKRDLFTATLQPWRSAAECIDWSIPCPSIFARKRPLAPATCRRIAAGLVRFVLQGKPFIVETGNGERVGQAPRVRSVDDPMLTVTGTGSQGALVAPSLVAMRGTGENHLHGDDAAAPLRTVSAGGQHHALVAAFLQQNFTGMVGKPLRVPVPTITAIDHHSLVTGTLIETAHGDFPERAGTRAKPLDVPTGVVTGSNNHALVAAHLTVFRENNRGRSVEEPMPTVTSGAGSVRPAGAAHATGVIAATLLANNTNNAPQRADAPLGTITTGDRHFLVASFLTQYYSQGATSSRVDAPLPAVVTKARHGLVTVEIDGTSYVVADIGLRMLEPRELARAQGFPDSYRLDGSKAQQIARIGNSVCPDIAAAIVRANIGKEAAVA